MKQRSALILATLAFIMAADIAVAIGLGALERRGAAMSLVRYFDYGRSAPGKIEAMRRADPATSLYDVAWRDTLLRASAEEFAAEDGAAPVVRSYGMSFVNHITDAAAAMRPGLVVDEHAGPGAPPNFTFAMFTDDRDNRRAGDIVVLGILSASVPNMAALSNRTWSFEQPAPFTYPLYTPDGAGGLVRINPAVETLADQERLPDDAELRGRWRRQLAEFDAYDAAVTRGAPALDVSPLARLTRRYLANYHLAKTRERVIAGKAYPYREVLNAMAADFAATARADGQIPVIVLIETLGSPIRLDEIMGETLAREAIPYLYTGEIHDPRDPAGYRPDGHFTPEVDARLGARFLEVVDAASTE